MFNAPAKRGNISTLVAEYNEKLDNLQQVDAEACHALKNYRDCMMVQGEYGGGNSRDLPEYSEYWLARAKENLLRSAWRAAFKMTKMEHIAPKTHLKEVETMLQNPQAFTPDNLIAVFGDYVADPVGMSIQAFAEVFCSLDPYYKSHSNVKVGVKGLPKRIIVSGCAQWGGGAWGWSKIADVVNSLMRYRGKLHMVVSEYTIRDIATGKGTGNLISDKERAELMGTASVENMTTPLDILADKRPYLNNTEPKYEGLEFRLFANGNCHVYFDKQALQDINLVLSRYYGNVLPDAYEHTDKKAESKEVSKDLAFYRTPQKAAKRLVDEAEYRMRKEGVRILEPSCGDGALLREIKQKLIENDNHTAEVVGVEYDAGRAADARSIGYPVYTSNFLTWQDPSKKEFDMVIMNPPFAGQHYVKHLTQAMKLLKDDGVLFSILPYTAKENEATILKETGARRIDWRDLPMGSFRESGTNVNTVILTLFP